MTDKHQITIMIEDEHFCYVNRWDTCLPNREVGDELFDQLTDLANNYESKLMSKTNAKN